jgi:site-specific DNA-methyltransferase (adenine-specific)
MSSNSYNPDVLSCLANLSSDEVFTPPALANRMLDLLPPEIWSDQQATFLDPGCKSGVFLREIAKRLDKGLKQQIPDRQQRLNHIFEKQIFGLAITELTDLLSRRSVYCSKTANGKYSVCETFDNPEGNIRFGRVDHAWENGRCRHCGANKENYERDGELETHAYEFIHTENPEEIFNMKFDVIVGNPPYQLDTGGSGRQAKPIYNLFVQQAKKLNPRFITMIIPSRWFAGGMGLDEFRKEMLNDSQLRIIVDYVDARECFPGVDIAGGVCFFLWARMTSGDCVVRNRFQGAEYESVRKLNEFKSFVRFGPAVNILRKVVSKQETSMTQIISATRPFGLQTKDRPDGKGGIRLISSGGSGNISKARVTCGQHMIGSWKVMTSKTSHDHAGQPDKDGRRRVLSRVEILEPNAVCTESYIILGAFEQKTDAMHCMEYVQTRFVRFLVSLLSFSQDITRERFAYVPMQDFTEPWTDEKLYAKYGLTRDEIAFIESMVRPMEASDE